MTDQLETKTDWGVQATDKFVGLVDKVRDRTTGPLLKVVRAIVYGLIVVVAAVVALLLVLIAFIHLLDGYLPGEVWGVYLILGAVFGLVGLVLWSKRTP